MSKEVLRNVGIGQKNEDGKFTIYYSFYRKNEFIGGYQLDFTWEINKFWYFL